MRDRNDLRPPVEATRRRHRAYAVIFGHDTRPGRIFDVVLIGVILASVLVIMLESVTSVRAEYGHLLRGAEWFFTLLFTVEYVTRLWCVGRPLTYAKSPLGLIDLLSVLPTYISLLVPGGQVITVVRILRVLRVFRILKLAHYVGEARVLARALRASQYKITIFVLFIFTITVIVGSFMYLIEGPSNGFTSIPVSMYWAIVTMTTVGYGDIAPHTVGGRILASALMILGYGVIAVPTGILSVELARASRPDVSTQACPNCSREGHDADAQYCKFCGSEL
ncbi:MAG: ion transporter [Gemmatimonadetes bacterium]|nr:ion transporter [Gemmatimonadota bacterium]